MKSAFVLYAAAAKELAIVFIAAMNAIGFTAAGATILTNSDFLSFQEGIKRGGRVKLDFDGTLRLEKSLVIETNTTVDASGHLVSLDGGKQVRHFEVKENANLTLINLRVMQGFFQGAKGETNQPAQPGFGGAITVDGGELTLLQCTLTGNHSVGGSGGTALQSPISGGAAFGGAIYAVHSSLWISNCWFSGNSCTGGIGSPSPPGYSGRGGSAFGGAVFATNCHLMFSEVTFTNNACRGALSGGGSRPQYGGGSAWGGALADFATSGAIDRCLFTKNRSLGGVRFGNETASANGAGMFHAVGSIKINECVFSGNLAQGYAGGALGGEKIVCGDGNGGAIYLGEGELEISNSALVSNRVTGGIPASCCGVIAQGGDASGGGLFTSGTLSLLNCTLFENNATGGAGSTWLPIGGSAYGGALRIRGGQTMLLNVTIAENSVVAGEGNWEGAPPPKALGASIYAGLGTAIMTNVILSCSASQTNAFGNLLDGGHNISTDLTPVFTLVSSYNGRDPRLGSLASNGEFTPTIPLLPDSPAIDQGDDTACPPTDQRGMKRPIGLACDIGAFELAPAVTLVRSQDQGMTVSCEFQAGRTNQLMASTNLVNWTLLGMGLSGTNGVFGFEDRSALQTPGKFYRVEIR